ncbi:MAG: hypothetical protein R3D80_04560 [Paracoccaceae bacterium]
MDTIYTEKHRLRDAQSELSGGELVYPFERPSRMDYILARLNDRPWARSSSPTISAWTRSSGSTPPTTSTSCAPPGTSGRRPGSGARR